MKRETFEDFYNDTFKVLLIFKDSEIELEEGKFSLLTFDDIGNKLGLTRQTIAKHVKILEEKGYIENVRRGRIKITQLGYSAIKKLY